ncbi:kinase-like protein [Hesseltinella vesiculosa]|uniref:Kinase-like protein n=1 Tax=Hesseltinella vesiculosa TaxID=101127 RepID=A0A1X2GUG3_9FUNG|nr:kinase-like protein [Hesseltinella vesiculosa]
MTTSPRHVYDQPQSDNVIVGIHHQLGPILGKGSFGVIYEGRNLSTQQPVAIKFESCDAPLPLLENEYEVYQVMRGTEGVPRIHYLGREGIDKCMVMDLLGPSLEDLFDMCGRQFSVKTVVGVGKAMISRLQSVHERYFVFRDVKPDNFLIGNDPNTKNDLYLIDFGMAKRYKDPKTQRHACFKTGQGISGTARYMSINAHLGREQSRRDDMESLAYVLLYFLRGSLPWQGIHASSHKIKYEKICQMKQETPPADLCSSFPEQFATLLEYTRALRYDEAPDYDHCRDLLDQALQHINQRDDGCRDWMLLNDGRGWEAQGRKRPKPALLLMPS